MTFFTENDNGVTLHVGSNMPAKIRVHELASELGIPSKDVLAKVNELGEFVKSASSTIEEPVARQLRAALRQAPHRVDVRAASSKAPFPKNPFGLGQPATAEGYPRDIPERVVHQDQTEARVRPRHPPRPWHRGQPPTGLTRFLLDELIITRRAQNKPEPPPRFRYWADEVQQAEAWVAEWGGCLLDGLSQDDIAGWIRLFGVRPVWNWNSESSVDYVAASVEFHRAGILPTELAWNYEDKGRSLADRLLLRAWTVEQIITEVEGRRSREAQGTNQWSIDLPVPGSAGRDALDDHTSPPRNGRP